MSEYTLEYLTEKVLSLKDASRESRADMAVHAMRWVKYNVLNYSEEEMHTFWDLFFLVLLDCEPGNFDKWYNLYVDRQLDNNSNS